MFFSQLVTTCLSGFLYDLHRSVVVAVIAVGVMKAPVDEVVDVVPVRDGLVPAVWAMGVLRVVAEVCFLMITDVGISRRHLDGMLLDLPALGLVMEVPVVEVIDVALMLDRRVAAAFAVLVVVIIVCVGHGENSVDGGKGLPA